MLTDIERELLELIREQSDRGKAIMTVIQTIIDYSEQPGSLREQEISSRWGQT